VIRILGRGMVAKRCVDKQVVCRVAPLVVSGCALERISREFESEGTGGGSKGPAEAVCLSH
jgi:hypothetical protein